MLEIIAYSLAALILGLVLVRFFAPALLVDVLIALGRRSSKLKRKTITVDGWIWTYLEGGDNNTEIVVMIHGFGGDKDNWTLYARYFVGAYHVIIPDLPGFGEQARKEDQQYGGSDQSQRLEDFLNALGISECHMAGNSMGGYITLVHALERPSKLKSITLLNNAGIKPPVKNEVEKGIDEGKNLLKFNDYEGLNKIIDMVTYKSPPLPEFVKKVQFKRAIHWQNFQDKIFWTLVEEGLGTPLNERLKDVPVPTFIIWGQHDRIIDVSAVPIMLEGIPDVQSVTFDDMGHVPMLENPKKTSRHHIKFLSALH